MKYFFNIYMQDDSINENRKDVYEEHSKSKENPKEEARQERKRRKAEILLDKKVKYIMKKSYYKI